MPIFESPDKGETVYVREECSTERNLHSVSEVRRSLHKEIKENQFNLKKKKKIFILSSIVEFETL